MTKETQNESAPGTYPYKLLAPVAQIVKALLQMAIGVIAVGAIIHRFWVQWDVPLDSWKPEDYVFARIGLALGIAAAVELAYTLFTDGPDEVLDPLMLGVAAALLLQLGKVHEFNYHDGIAALLYVTALAALFAVRERLLIEKQKSGDFSAWRHLYRSIFKAKPKSADGGKTTSADRGAVSPQVR